MDEPNRTIADLAARVQRLEDATATGYVRVYVSDPDTRNPGLWRIGFTKVELVRTGTTWRIATRLSRSLGEEDGASMLRDGV